jgi:hypothetical protein
MYGRLCAAALLTAVIAGPAVAQTTTTTPPSTTAARPVPVDDRRDDFDWGWLGLLGLAGLAPLFMRKDRQGNVHADTRR